MYSTVAPHGCACVRFILHFSIYQCNTHVSHICNQVCFSFVSLLFVVLVTEAVLGEQAGVLCQRGTDLLLLLEASGVGHLDVAALGGRLVHDLLQPGIELAVHVVCGGGTARVLFVPRVAAILCWDLVQDLGFRLLLAGEGQLPPALIRHGTSREGED